MNVTEFETVGIDAWTARAEQALKGGSVSKLARRVAEGFDVQPLYTTAPSRGAIMSGRREVRVLGLLDGPLQSPLADAVALELEGGAHGVVAPAAGLEAAEHGLLLAADGVPVGAAPGRAWPLLDVCRWRDAVVCQGDLGWLGARVGSPGALVVDVRDVHEAGADGATEVGAALARVAAALRAAEAHGAQASTTYGALVVRIAVGPDFLLQTSKLRALRAGLAALAELGGLAGAHTPLLFGETSRRALSKTDPWVNLLRGTAGAFAAVTGGADLVGVQPFDRAARASDAAALRLARNTLHILCGESHLEAVADPAAGSFALETWTDTILAGAWSLLQQVDAAGGALSEAGEAVLTHAAEAVRRTRERRLRTRQDALVGTSVFVNAAETALEGPATNLDATLGGPRDGAAFEALRAHLLGTRVFVANVGPLAEQQARTGWVRDLLAVAGAVVIDGGDGFATAAEARAAMAASGARIAFISASDTRLPELMPGLAAGLREAGARFVVCAARPAPEWAADGVDAFVHVGVDVVTFLETALVAAGAHEDG
jgi:methylmalonyl-CoA mutase